MLVFDVRPRATRPRRCPVTVGRGALDVLVDDLLARPPGRTLALVSDSNVASLYGKGLTRRLRASGIAAHLLTFPAGEERKTRETKAALEDRLLALELGRDGALVAVGGGVTADLAGFTAATWHRGVPVVQVPTSLVAMVDAALGGKTAVNLPGGKNLVGAFHAPWAVWADITTLASLPEAEFRAGFAEVIKTAVVGDAALFRWLEGSAEALLGRDGDALERAVGACLRIKARVVAGDEREMGRRAMLNFGHTVGHALEAASGYRIRHGDAVAIGMRVEGLLAVETCAFPAAQLSRLERLLERFGLPAEGSAPLPPVEQIVTASRRDKKARGGETRCALPLGLGRMRPGREVTVPVAEALLRRALRSLV